MKKLKQILCGLLAVVIACTMIACDEDEGTKEKAGDPDCEHVWNAWEITEAATCSSKGKQTRECKECGRIETEKIPESKTAHTYINGICVDCDTELKPSEGLKFYLLDDEESYGVGGIGTCEDEVIVIPDTYNGMPVIYISSRCFEECENIVSVIIPDSVTEIGEKAFEDCSSLEKVVLPKGITCLDSRVFGGCTSLRRVEIPDGVIELETGAFGGCINLRTVDMPASVEWIDTYAFGECEKITINYAGTVAMWEEVGKPDGSGFASAWFRDTELITIHCTDGDIVIED